ncbi:DNA-directed RNA polymerases II and IV subunit 5A [Physcomitrium patens]|uniref:DNA-directed RNA polymerases II and IV subunit 5A n=1 Tax=Physcomitrium patens TaxID=3218 RepID=UPI003CCCFE13
MAEHVLDRQSTHLYQVRKKVLEMMRDLDYVVADNELTLTNEQFCEKYREDPKQEDLMILKPKSSNNAEHVMVFHEFFSPFPTLLSFCCAAHDVAAGVECLASRFLCSLPKGPKTGGKGRVGLKTIKTCKKRMKRENVPRAVFVVQQHITPLSKQYISRKAQKYHLEVFLLPWMQHNDPVARYYGINPGQVVKIIQSSETAGRYVTYRLFFIVHLKSARHSRVVNPILEVDVFSPPSLSVSVVATASLASSFAVLAYFLILRGYEVHEDLSGSHQVKPDSTSVF